MQAFTIPAESTLADSAAVEPLRIQEPASGSPEHAKFGAAEEKGS